MKISRWLAAILFLVVSLVAKGDDPFRIHRYDAFKACKVNRNSIVFIGNSITNMGAWMEQFGSDPAFLNRGNSGCYSFESLDELESILIGRPAKIFVMVGTNDIGGQTGTPESIALNARVMIERVKHESPETDIYITSCFPSKNGYRNLENLGRTNELLKEVCQETETPYVDLWDDLMGITTGALSTDNLHINAKGYYIWSKKILPLIGRDVQVALPENPELTTGGQNYAWGMRVGLFGALPVKSDDVLLLGDEMINGGEWHELLNCPRVKNRGTGWGYGGVIGGLPNWLNMIEPILKANASNKQTPAQIYLYAGVAQVNGNEALDNVVAQYRSVVDKIKELAPETTLHLMSLLPVSNTVANNRVSQFNEQLKAMAETTGAIYVDIFTPLSESDGTPNPRYITDNYVYAHGYNKIAHILAGYIGEDCTVMSEEDMNAHYERINARRDLGRVIDLALRLPQGSTTGTYDPTAVASLTERLNDIYALLSKEDATVEEMRALATEMQPLIEKAKTLNQPNETSWYTIRSSRRGDRIVSIDNENGALVGGTEEASTAAHWRFEQREDGTWNIVNRFSGRYINPGTATNNQLTTSTEIPNTGWNLFGSYTTGLYIITSGQTQMNQTTQALGWKVYNWGYNTAGFENTYNTTDAGCEFSINELATDAPAVDPGDIILKPTPSTSEKTYWQTFKTPLRNDKYTSATDAGPMVGVDSAEGELIQWKIVPRQGENTYDIVNRETGGYIDPSSAATNQQLTTSTTSPVRGWSFSPAATEGYYIFTSEGGVQLHQTNAGNSFKIFNWGGGNNTTDGGCQFLVRVVDVEKTGTGTGLDQTTFTPEPHPSTVYDLQGRRIRHSKAKGVYIVNGEKKLVK
ncbi:MAG: hypothetical protein J6B92_10580 [Paraprevotella sp.]|nr:hypothetical protein [Paraprevotella sp.]